eukprot:g10404.t1
MESHTTPHGWGLYKYRDQPRYLRENSVAETFAPFVKDGRHVERPAGYSKYILNQYPPEKHSSLGCQWDAEATLGTNNQLRHINHKYRQKWAFLPSKKLSDLRDPGKYKAGRFPPDAVEGKAMVPGNPNHHIVSMETMRNETVPELLSYARDGRAGEDPHTQKTPATGWVPPGVDTNYQTISPEMNALTGVGVHPTVQNMGSLHMSTLIEREV